MKYIKNKKPQQFSKKNKPEIQKIGLRKEPRIQRKREKDRSK